MAWKHRRETCRKPRTWLHASDILIIAELKKYFLERVEKERNQIYGETNSDSKKSGKNMGRLEVNGRDCRDAREVAASHTLLRHPVQ